jgi:hypothetical protein
MKPSTKPALNLFDPESSIPSPPRQLGQHGMNLWSGVLSEFNIQDRAGLELLAQACACVDRAEALAAQCEADGVVLVSGSGMTKSHPAIKDEITCRTACVRILEKLGVTREELRPTVGRPPKGWRS